MPCASNHIRQPACVLGAPAVPCKHTQLHVSCQVAMRDTGLGVVIRNDSTMLGSQPVCLEPQPQCPASIHTFALITLY
jgi:hypothetical protein